MMIGYFFIVHKRPFFRFRVLCFYCQCHLPVRTDRTASRRSDKFRRHSEVRYRESVLWISKYFMIFIETLHNIQSFLCRQSKPFVRIPLQFGQIIKQRWINFFLFPFCLSDDQAVLLTFLFLSPGHAPSDRYEGCLVFPSFQVKVIPSAFAVII